MGPFVFKFIVLIMDLYEFLEKELESVGVSKGKDKVVE